MSLRPIIRLSLGLGILLAVILISLLGTIYLAPSQSLEFLAQQFTRSQGIILRKVDIHSPWIRRNAAGFWEVFIARVDLSINEHRALLEGIEAQFTTAELLRGKFSTITLSDLELAIHLSNSDSSLSPTGSGNDELSLVSAQHALADAYEQMRGIPVGQFEIRAGRLRTDSPLQAVWLSESLPELKFSGALDMQSQRLAAFDINASTEIMGKYYETRLEGSLGEQSLQVRLSVDEQLFLTLAQEQLQTLLPDVGITISPSDQNSGIELEMRIEGSAIELRSTALTSSTQLSVLPNAEISLNLDSALLSCNTPTLCKGSSRLVVHVYPQDSGSFSIEGSDHSFAQIDVELPLSFAGSREEFDLDSPLANIEIREWSSGTTRGNVSLFFENLHSHRGLSNSLSANFESHELNASLAGIIPEEFRLEGSINANDEEFGLVGELSSAKRLLGGASISHSFGRDTGSIDLRIEPPSFNEESPLSSYLDFTALLRESDNFDSFDLIDGEARLRADIGWSRQSSGDWALGGPIIIQLDSLSGFVDDTLFVGARSNLFAELSPTMALRSTHPTTLTLDRIDSGLIFENASLAYEFTLTPQIAEGLSFELADVHAEFLDGSLTIPSIRSASLENQQPQLDLILSGLDLGSIIELANYPEVSVQGRVSGYLPIDLRLDAPDDESQFLVKRGLVSALKPGGVIRYLPLDEISSNQNIRLVNEALANYQFNTLDTTLDVAKDGEMTFGVVLAGHNPDMNGGQAINLNVNISDNLLDLLNSLRASRDITDELERRLRD